MLRGTDQQYLRTDQYKDATKLNVRMALHQKFGTGKIDWHCWVFDQFDLPTTARILELGCGPGQLWVRNLDRIPNGWQLVLSDYSKGMIDQAQSNLADSPHPISYSHFDAQSIPFSTASFDAVVANHMLYHVPDRRKVYAEAMRVLKPGGIFYAATNARDYMAEIKELERRIGLSNPFVPEDFFDLEVGKIELKSIFPQVTLHKLKDTLAVTEAQPLIDYILSSIDGGAVTLQAVDSLKKIIEGEIAEKGAFRVSKSTGLFIAANS